MLWQRLGAIACFLSCNIVLARRTQRRDNVRDVQSRAAQAHQHVHLQTLNEQYVIAKANESLQEVVVSMPSDMHLQAVEPTPRMIVSVIRYLSLFAVCVILASIGVWCLICFREAPLSDSSEEDKLDAVMRHRAEQRVKVIEQCATPRQVDFSQDSDDVGGGIGERQPIETGPAEQRGSVTIWQMHIPSLPLGVATSILSSAAPDDSRSQSDASIQNDHMNDEEPINDENANVDSDATTRVVEDSVRLEGIATTMQQSTCEDFEAGGSEDLRTLGTLSPRMSIGGHAFAAQLFVGADPELKRKLGCGQVGNSTAAVAEDSIHSIRARSSTDS